MFIAVSVFQVINQKRVRPGYPDTEKQMIIVSRCLETPVKHVARVQFGMASKTSHTSFITLYATLQDKVKMR